MLRRSFLASTSLAFGSSLFSADAPETPLFITTNTYPWGTFHQREGRQVAAHSEELLADIAASGIQGYEAIYNTPAEFSGLKERLAKHGLRAASMYVNSTLHDERAEKSIAEVLAMARPALELGIGIVVTNPSPIAWGGQEIKTDAQLLTQARALDKLGEQLRQEGLTLAYHNHDAELKAGAREFHHMLTATNPDHVKFCLDAHWVFRGCGNSQVALFDAVALHGERIVELHLRQSQNGVWTEAFGKGDLDYARLHQWLKQRGKKPLLCLEQAVENGTAKTMSGVEAHRLSLEQARQLFQA